jgi:hypothetical protein
MVILFPKRRKNQKINSPSQKISRTSEILFLEERGFLKLAEGRLIFLQFPKAWDSKMMFWNPKL